MNRTEAHVPSHNGYETSLSNRTVGVWKPGWLIEKPMTPTAHRVLDLTLLFLEYGNNSPVTKEFAAMLQISPRAVIKALDELDDYGVLTYRKEDGCFIVTLCENAGSW